MVSAQTQSRSIFSDGRPFSYDELTRLCHVIVNLVPVVMLGNHRVVLHGMLPVLRSATRTHTHTTYEAQLLLDGIADCYTDTDHQVLTPGQVTLHAPGVPHSWRQYDIPFLRLTLWFSITPAPPMHSVTQWPFQPQTFATLQTLLDDVYTCAPGWCDRVTPQVSLLLSRLLMLTNWPVVEVPDFASDTSFLLLLNRFLENNLQAQFSHQDIANYFGMSERTLSRQLLRHTGTTLFDYIESLRLNRAHRLLLETSDTIDLISHLVGYTTSSYFCHRFHHHFGVSPGQFRKQRAPRNSK